MSTLRVTGLKQETSSATNISMAVGGGVTVAGIATFHNNAIFTNDVAVSGNISIGGTLTYQDVTNIDSVGIITANAGIDISNTIVSNNDSTIRYDNYTFIIDVDSNNVRGSSEFKVNVDNVNALTIDDNRRIGIGTDNPSDNLQILHTNGKGLTFKTTENHYAQITSDCNRTGVDSHLLAIEGHWNGTPVAEIALTSGGDNIAKDDGQIIFRTSSENNLNSGERLRISGAGKLILPTGSPGIQFGTTDSDGSITSQTLDDYEEGYWTPTVNSGGNPSSTLTVTRARYTKIGRQVTIGCELGFTGGDGGNFRLQGLPFNTATAGTGSGQIGAGMNAVGAVLFNNLNITGLNCLGAYIYNNLIYFYYTAATDGASWTELDGDHVGGNSSGGNLIFTITYFT